MKHSFRILSLSWTLILLMMAPACDPRLEPEPEPEPEPEEIHPVFLDCSSFYRFADMDSVVVLVLGDDEAQYDISIPDDAATWISTSTLHGTKSAYIGFEIGVNTSGQTRTATISFQYAKNSFSTLQIKQDYRKRSDCYWDWGLNGTVQQVKRNDRPYNWYIDQSTTGTHSSNNCGPSCVTMAAKWADRTYSLSAAYARTQFRPNGGWWYMNDITGFLELEHVTYRTLTPSGPGSFVSELDQGNIVIICLDMNLLSYSSEDACRVDRFYTTTPEWGHFLVVYGYVQTDQKLYLEVCDPNSYARAYSDGTLKGYGRYYQADEVYHSVISWSSRVCVVERAR